MAYRRVRKNEIGMLPGSEFKAGTTCIEPEGHCILGDSLPIH
jgi:hypothetical protein